MQRRIQRKGGPGGRPALCLETCVHSNRTFKYADDFTLLVPENTDVSAESEIAHITSWSQSSKLNIKLNKCKDLIFNRPNPKHEISIYDSPME